jgi:signal peptidase I
VLSPVPYAVVIPIVALVAFDAWVMSDAWRVARRAPEAYVPRWYNRWYLYLLLVFGSGLLANGPLSRFIKAHIVEAFKMPTGSMDPTVLVGDFFYVTPLRGPVRRGDLVVFRRNGIFFVKRAVALGGDTVSMRRDSLFVNARFVPEPYVKLGDAPPEMSTWGPLVVSDRAYFVLGDNRANSLDSRQKGPVDADWVIKRPLAIYFSWDPDEGAVRWSRIGRTIRR